MKKCCSCKITKDLESFYKNNSVKNGRQSRCIDCQTKLGKEYRSTSYGRQMRTIGRTEYRFSKRKFIYDLLNVSSCIDCGISDWRVLEFDHVRGEKFKNISYMIKNHSIDRIKQEITKCEIRCANCHRIRTASQFGWYEDIIGEDK